MPSVAEIVHPEEQIERDLYPAIDDQDPPDWNDDSGGGDGDDGEPIRWVLVATFWSVDQAHLARLKLEAQDIPCLMDDANLVAMNWLYANAVGGVKLRVPEEDAVNAMQILGTAPQVEAQPTEDCFEDRCPTCGSTDIYRARVSRRGFFLSWLLLGIPLPFLSRKLRCSRCGGEWRREARGFPAQ